MEDWQRTDFAALDAAWLALAGHDVVPLFQRAYIERPRGHSKTSDMAMQIAWILMFSRRPVRGLAAAADRDQALLIRTAVREIVRLNPVLCEDLEFRQHAILNKRTGSMLDVITSDVRSSWGALPDLVICDELCHWEHPELWYSLISSAAKRPHCVVVVLTNAGIGRSWQWVVRETARQHANWYFSTFQGVRASWIPQKWLDEQKLLLPGPVYDRLWENIWQHSDGEFVTLAEAEACREPQLTIQEWGRSDRRYIAAVDYAEKHDYTVGVVLHREGPRLVVDRMDVAVPAPGSPVRVVWVDDWMRRTAARFRSVTFVIDEYQLLGTIQRYEQAYDVRRFEFLGGRGNHALALALRNLIVHRGVAWYPDCGAIDAAHGRDDLETELASLILKQSQSGHCRIDHRPDQIHHDDRAFALGAACLHAIGATGDNEWMQITPPQPTGTFLW
ncbi:MAG: terminase [Planctomycetaceae bacterium]|nr:terminase [Planctomycetaceae bacterium]